MKPYKLTVAVPIYNTAQYLQETFLCIENQSIGFENMEVILVNDGSNDLSGVICKKFQKKYTENVRYVELSENRGAGHARNTALDLARGEYITFWDSDDLWSLNAMEQAVIFLDKHKAEIDMVSSNIEHFDNYTHPHLLNFEVDRNAIIDIKKEYKKIRTTGAVCVIRTEVARQYRTDEKQSCWEDTKYINQILLRKKKYGMLSDVIYYYRRRKDNNSASQLRTGNKQYYLHDLKSFYQGVYGETVKQCGEFIPMMQYLVAYTLGYFMAETVTILNDEEQHRYEEIQKEILTHIEDRYIQEIPNADMLVKWKMLAVKHDILIKDEIDQWREKEQSVYWTWNRLERTTANFKILKKWFELKQQSKNIKEYFIRNQYYRVAVYGLSDLGIYLLRELNDNGLQVVYGVDRRAEKLEMDVPVFTLQDNLPGADVIIVTAVYFFRQIDEELRTKVECPVISLEDVLYTVE